MYTHTHTYRLTYPLGTTLVSAGLAYSEGRYKLQEDIPEDNILPQYMYYQFLEKDMWVTQILWDKCTPHNLGTLVILSSW